MKKTMAWIAAIAAIVFFANIAGCPAQKEAGRTPLPRVEYVNTNNKTDVENYLHGLGF